MKEKFHFDQSFGSILGVAYTAVYRRPARYMKEHNLPIKPDPFRVMTYRWQNDGCSQQDLANWPRRNLPDPNSKFTQVFTPKISVLIPVYAFQSLKVTLKHDDVRTDYVV